MRAWERAGVYLPHYSVAQYADTEHVPVSQARPGDLVFFANNTSDPGSIHHVAIYIGGGRMIEAPHTGRAGADLLDLALGPDAVRRAPLTAALS